MSRALVARRVPYVTPQTPARPCAAATLAAGPRASQRAAAALPAVPMDVRPYARAPDAHALDRPQAGAAAAGALAPDPAAAAARRTDRTQSDRECSRGLGLGLGAGPAAAREAAAA